MGGFGSGERLSKKTTVEECLKLGVGRFVKQGSLKPQTLSVGELTWTNNLEERILLVRYWLENTLQKTVLHLTSRVDRHGREDSMWEDIVLTSTKPNLGGVRWWFICPLIDKGRPCTRRVGKLYWPPSALYFGCRVCFNLTYESAQTHDDRVNRLMKNPVALANAINSSNPMEELRGLQAYAKAMGWLK